MYPEYSEVEPVQPTFTGSPVHLARLANLLPALAMLTIAPESDEAGVLARGAQEFYGCRDTRRSVVARLATDIRVQEALLCGAAIRGQLS